MKKKLQKVVWVLWPLGCRLITCGFEADEIYGDGKVEEEEEWTMMKNEINDPDAGRLEENQPRKFGSVS